MLLVNKRLLWFWCLLWLGATWWMLAPTLLCLGFVWVLQEVWRCYCLCQAEQPLVLNAQCKHFWWSSAWQVDAFVVLLALNNEECDQQCMKLSMIPREVDSEVSFCILHGTQHLIQHFPLFFNPRRASMCSSPASTSLAKPLLKPKSCRFKGSSLVFWQPSK